MLRKLLISLVLVSSCLAAQKPMRGTILDRSHPLSRGLVGCWIMNERTGLLLNDITGNGYDITLTNNSMWGSHGVTGNDALDYGICDSSRSYLGGAGGNTLIAKFRTTDSGLLYGTLIGSYSAASASSGFSLQVSSDEARVFKGGTGVDLDVPDLDDGVWHTLAAVDDGTASEDIDVYLDGELAGTLNNAAFDTERTVALPFTLLGFEGGEAYILDGDVEYCMAYSRMLSANEIKSITDDPYQVVQDDHVIVAAAQAAAESNTGAVQRLLRATIPFMIFPCLFLLIRRRKK